MPVGFVWGGNLGHSRTAGAGIDCGKRGKANRRTASKRARRARKANR